MNTLEYLLLRGSCSHKTGQRKIWCFCQFKGNMHQYVFSLEGHLKMLFYLLCPLLWYIGSPYRALNHVLSITEVSKRSIFCPWIQPVSSCHLQIVRIPKFQLHHPAWFSFSHFSAVVFSSAAIIFSLSIAPQNSLSVCSIIISMVTIKDVKLSTMHYGNNLSLSSTCSLHLPLSSVASSSSFATWLYWHLLNTSFQHFFSLLHVQAV